MNPSAISVNSIREKDYRLIPIIDVRSPSEFRQGHIPDAINIPLFNDDERAIIGTLYKEAGKDKAVSRGLEITGPKLAQFYKILMEHFHRHERLLVHCWRGGMRSSSMAWLFSLSGKQCFTLQGGYKAYRQFIIDEFKERRYKLCILGGRTGCRKTELLGELKSRGEQVIDLEALADHKGSAFGWIGRTTETGTEQFENSLAEALYHLDPSRCIWMENESRAIGKCQIPEGIWTQMREADLIHLDMDKAWRIENLVNIYFSDNAAQLEFSFEKIRSRLGHLKTDQAISHIRAGEYGEAADIALDYYDKTYDYGLTRRAPEKVHILKLQKENLTDIADKIIEFRNKNIRI